jgi:hypothetical protein
MQSAIKSCAPVAAIVALDGLHEPDVPLLDQVHHVAVGAPILVGDLHHQPQVRRHQAGGGVAVARLHVAGGELVLFGLAEQRVLLHLAHVGLERVILGDRGVAVGAPLDHHGQGCVVDGVVRGEIGVDELALRQHDIFIAIRLFSRLGLLPLAHGGLGFAVRVLYLLGFLWIQGASHSEGEQSLKLVAGLAPDDRARL